MKPLSHLRVVELGTLPAGAYAARLFADFGAEVIKVEQGDPTRAFPPIIAPQSPTSALPTISGLPVRDPK